ncbi:AGAP003562-PA [Anopheles gambiae str. PEST]|uniref:AGAP003562-PA n=1 Tax=Anopheles gambiae TaxID=7165 RepID=Q5TT52_ANOGA|nr:AGAP003562-PA [Anopheles gambiae str. PEST]
MSSERDCALCLTSESKWLLDVFSESNRDLHMASVISKHLWFDLNPASEPHICMDCWTTIHNFHRYYTKLEALHDRDDGITVDESTANDEMGELKNIEFLEEDAEELRMQMKQIPNASYDGSDEQESPSRGSAIERNKKSNDQEFSLFEIEVEQDGDGTVYRLDAFENHEQTDRPESETRKQPVILNGQMKPSSAGESSTVAIDFFVPEDEPPVKRGRGRPRKQIKVEPDTSLRIIKKENNSSMDEHNTSLDSTGGNDEQVPVKRRRGRPPKNASVQRNASPIVPTPRAIKREVKTEREDEDAPDSGGTSRPERRSTRVRKAKYFSDMEQDSNEEEDEEEEVQEEETEPSEYEPGDDPEYEARLQLQRELNMDDFAFYEYQCSLENDHGARDNKIFQYVDEFACHVCEEKVTFKRFAEAHLHYRVEHNQPPYLKCPRCEKKCHTPGMFVSHMETHDDPEKNKCQICGKYTDCNISLKKHMRVHQSQLEENLPYPCSLCKRKFETEDLREKHEKLHVPKPHVPKEKGPDHEVLDFYKVIACDICEEEQTDSPTYDNLSDLRAHMVKEHNKNMYLRCPYCSTRQVNRQQVITHIDMHNNPDKYRCEVCKEVHQNLHQHMMKAHAPTTTDEADKKYKCDQCGRSFNFLANLKMHVDCVHGVKDVKCNVCNKFFNYRAYRTHKRTAHTDLMLMCELCPKMFKNRKSFEVHKASHEGLMLRMTNCVLCGKLIRTCSMSKHMKTIHSEEDPVNCDLCGKMFRTTFHMKRHQKNTCEVTMDSRSFKCEVCGKGFSTKLTMMEHMTTHTRTNQYQCAFCFKSFGYISNLYKHRKKAHPLEWQEVQAHPEENIASVIVVRN